MDCNTLLDAACRCFLNTLGSVSLGVNLRGAGEPDANATLLDADKLVTGRGSLALTDERN